MVIQRSNIILGQRWESPRWTDDCAEARIVASVDMAGGMFSLGENSKGK